MLYYLKMSEWPLSKAGLKSVFCLFPYLYEMGLSKVLRVLLWGPKIFKKPIRTFTTPTQWQFMLSLPPTFRKRGNPWFNKNQFLMNRICCLLIRPDYLVTIDVNPTSANYSKVNITGGEGADYLVNIDVNPANAMQW